MEKKLDAMAVRCACTVVHSEELAKQRLRTSAAAGSVEAAETGASVLLMLTTDCKPSPPNSKGSSDVG